MALKLELSPDLKLPHDMGITCDYQTASGKCKNKAHYLLGNKRYCTYHFDYNIVKNGNCYLEGIASQRF